MSILDPLLDASVYWSFDRSGYLRHARSFRPEDLTVDLRGRRWLITGANSGIGLELARGLAARGAEVWMGCRSLERGEAARREAGAARVLQVDVGDAKSTDRLIAEAGGAELDGIIHNAGLLPDREVRAGWPDGRGGEEQVEQTAAVHLLGPHRITAGLAGAMRRGARVIWVSSGGMYTKRLDLAAIRGAAKVYDGVAAYAHTKRAQVILSELWAARLKDSGVESHCMHPGWASTPGVSGSLPAFDRWMQGRLRSAAEGADTALWLACCATLPAGSGTFWFDRAPAKTHFVPWTRETAAQREELWAWCDGR